MKNHLKYLTTIRRQSKQLKKIRAMEAVRNGNSHSLSFHEVEYLDKEIAASYAALFNLG